MESMQSLQRSVLWCACITANIPQHIRRHAQSFVLAGKRPPAPAVPELVKFLSKGLKVSHGYEALRDISALAATLINELEQAPAVAVPVEEWRQAA